MDETPFSPSFRAREKLRPHAIFPDFATWKHPEEPRVKGPRGVVQVAPGRLCPKAKRFAPKAFVGPTLGAAESAEATFTVSWTATAYHAIWHFLFAIFHLFFGFQKWRRTRHYNGCRSRANWRPWSFALKRLRTGLFAGS